MIKINQIKVSSKLPLDKHEEEITKKLTKKLNIKQSDIKSLEILKRSIDARKDEVNYVYSLAIDVAASLRLSKNDRDISPYEAGSYEFPKFDASLIKSRPVVIGLGPAGLFCAYMLAKNGFRPIVLERGKCVDDRTKDVEHFWATGVLDTESNVQFGEGGAGSFSDGKLNTLVKDKVGRNKEVLRVLVECGAPAEILYDNKPHIGTDILKTVVKNLSDKIREMGGEIHYQSKVTDFEINNNSISAVFCNEKRYETDTVVLAIGHSARDTFELLKELEIDIEAKAFAVGFRVMHPQDIIDINQYGPGYEELELPVSSYKVTSNLDRGVYSFCMCPGGYVVNASSEEGRLVVNGMSYHKRDSKVANSAIIIQVTPKDYESEDCLAGMYWQRKLEEKAYQLAAGRIPLQKYGEFKAKNSGLKNGGAHFELEPAVKGGYEYCDLGHILPEELNKNFINAMEFFAKKIDHFNDDNVIMAGIESRSSSPIRINRDETANSSVKGLYPCGEGAGYAGGITSAAMDGIYIAEMIAKNL